MEVSTNFRVIINNCIKTQIKVSINVNTTEFILGTIQDLGEDFIEVKKITKEGHVRLFVPLDKINYIKYWD